MPVYSIRGAQPIGHPPALSDDDRTLVRVALQVGKPVAAIARDQDVSRQTTMRVRDGMTENTASFYANSLRNRSNIVDVRGDLTEYTTHRSTGTPDNAKRNLALTE
jgi:hypothetical protein